MHCQHLTLSLLAVSFVNAAVVQNANVALGAQPYAVPNVPASGCTTWSDTPSKTTLTGTPTTTNIPVIAQSVPAQNVTVQSVVTSTLTRVLEQFCSTGVENKTVTATVTVTPNAVPATTPGAVNVVPQGFRVVVASCGADCGYTAPVTSSMTICTACGVAASPAGAIVPQTAAKDSPVAPGNAAPAAASPTTYAYNPAIPPSPAAAVPTTEIPVNAQGFSATGASPSTQAAAVSPVTPVSPASVSPSSNQRVNANSVSPASPSFTGGASIKGRFGGYVGLVAVAVGAFQLL